MSFSQPKTRLVLLLIAFLATAFALSKTSAFANETSKKILVLHWQDSFSIGVMNMDRILYEDLLKNSPQPIDFYSEYLQFSKFTNMDIQVDALALLKKKYAQMDLDLIITTDDPDYQFAISYRNEIFPNVPIVFIGVNKDTVFASQTQPDVTGNYKMLDVDTSISNIERLFPNTKNLVVISGASRQDAQYFRILKEGLMPYADTYNISYTVDMTMPQILALTAQLPSETCVIYASMFNDAAGTSFSPPLVAAEIAKASTAPVFVYSENMIGSGVIGGNVVDFTSLAHDGASRAIKVLNGTPPSDIPIETPPNLNYFDANVLKKFNINEKTLPSGSVLVDKSMDVTEAKRTVNKYQPGLYLIAGGSLIALLALAVYLIRRLNSRSGKY